MVILLIHCLLSLTISESISFSGAYRWKSLIAQNETNTFTFFLSSYSCETTYFFPHSLTFQVNSRLCLILLPNCDPVSSFGRGKWCFNDTDGRCWCWYMWSRRPSGSDGFRLCYGTVSLSEEITSCTRALELSAHRLHDPLQLLPQCCLCANAFLVRAPLAMLVFSVNLFSSVLEHLDFRMSIACYYLCFTMFVSLCT